MLKRLFIKDYKNTKDNNVRNKYGIVSCIYGIVSNLILTIIKLITGVITNSVSIIADGINMAVQPEMDMDEINKFLN